MRFPRLGLLPLFLPLICSPFLAQDQMTYANLKTSKFATLPVLPACMTVSVLPRRPTEGPGRAAGKLKARLQGSWHWHTAAENLVRHLRKRQG